MQPVAIISRSEQFREWV